MPATPTCKPWCRNHQDPDECVTQINIWNDGKKEGETVDPSTEPLAAEFHALGGFPGIVTAIDLVVFQEEEDEQPIMDLQIYATGYTEEVVSRAHLGTDGLKELHSTLGVALQNLSKGG